MTGGIQSMLRGGSGETFQTAFTGQGAKVVSVVAGRRTTTKRRPPVRVRNLGAALRSGGGGGI